MVLAVLLYVGLLVGSLLLFAVGLLTVRDGFRRYEERIAVADRPVAPPGSVAMGPTVVRGTARPDGDPERLPFGGGEEAAVCYHVTVEDTNKVEPPHVDRRVAPPFFVEGGDGDDEDEDGDDVGGRVRVDADGLELDLGEDRWERFEVASHESLPEDLASFVESEDLPDQGLDRDRAFEYEYVAPGDEVTVAGRAVPDDRTPDDPGEKAVLVTAGDGRGGGGDGGFLADTDPETLRNRRRWTLARHVGLGVGETVVGLAGFLWLSGIAQVFLGA